MKTTYGGYDYYIEFKHDFDPDWENVSASRNGTDLIKYGKLRMDGQAIHRRYNRTTCRIIRRKQGDPLGSASETLFCAGKGFCSISDNFCKEYGRKGALKNALEGRHAVHVFPADLDGPEGKALRKAIWKAYLGRKEHDDGTHH